MAVCVVLAVLFKVPDIIAALVALIPPVSVPVKVGVAQLYKVPAGTMPLVILVGVNVNDVPLQMILVIALMEAEGLMVTVTVNTALLQLPDKGVTI